MNIAVLALHHFSSLQSWDSTYQELGTFLMQLLLWELVLVIAVSYVFYQLLHRYTRYKEETSEFQTLLIQAISHKLGNFLATHRVDLELIKESGSEYALNRLENSYFFLERDFRHLLEIIKEYEFEKPQKESVELGSLIQTILEHFDPEQKGMIRLRLQQASLTASLPELETMVFLLLENALRYSQSGISIRCGVCNSKTYLCIINDIHPGSEKGSGVGLSIASRLGGRNRLRLSSRTKNNKYTVVLSEIKD